MALIDWKKYNPLEQFYVIEDIVGMCLMYEKSQHPHGEFKIDTGGGGFIYSLFITWQRADPFNKNILMDVLMHFINKYKIDDKVRQLRVTYPETVRMSREYLGEHGIEDPLGFAE